MPARLAAKYHEGANDPDLLSLRDEVRLVDARVSELLEQLGTAAGAERWEALAAAHRGLDAARRTGNTAAMAQALTHMGALITEGVKDGEVWGELYDAINARRRLVQAESRRLQQLHQMVTVERVVVLMAAIAESVRTHVTDERSLQCIQADMRRLLARPESEAPR